MESGRTGLGGAMQQFAGNPDVDTQVGCKKIILMGATWDI